MQMTSISPGRIEALHGVTDTDKYEALVESMTADGWIGAPIVIVDREDCDSLAATGSHRIEAAREADIDIPVVRLADLCAAHGLDWAQMLADAEVAACGDPVGTLYDAIVEATYALPADVTDAYGLDAH